MKFYLTLSPIKRCILFIFFIAFFFFLLKFFLFGTSNIATSPYYAVFLTNGQVYFGHIEKSDQLTISLANVYYLRANTNLQTIQTKNKKSENVELALIKLGNELHGPKDMMVLNRTSILFWEELRNDGKMVQAIKRYQP